MPVNEEVRMLLHNIRDTLQVVSGRLGQLDKAVSNLLVAVEDLDRKLNEPID